MKNLKKVVYIIVGIAMAMFGIFIVPKLLKKCTEKLYKNSHKNIDFDDFGPEIVKKDTKEKEVDGN